ncbi:MAG TPA: phospholipid carrier-dependent glycosyltransferase [Pyrinomonadaceae bacterium]|nr:phospholipid carrier-dependent glycosyltransferase [Pyrinomonadaceae bacterium]
MDDSLTGKRSEADVFESGRIQVEIRACVGNALRLIAAHKAEAACAGMLLLMALNLFVSISRKSLTNDETAHIPAGYYHLVAGDFQLNTEHPPLIKMWATLPLLFIQPNEPKILTNANADFAQRSAGVEQQFWTINQDHFLSLGFWPRIMMIPISMTLGIVIFLFTRALWNATAALLALFLYCVEPTVLAHGRVVHTDIPAALGYLLFVFALFHYHQLPTRKRAIVLGIVTALALLTKYSLIILVPALLLYACMRAWSIRRDANQLKSLVGHGAVVSLIVILFINCVYFFRHDQLSAPDVEWLIRTSGIYSGAVVKLVTALSHVIPAYYLFGVYKVVIHNHFGHPAFLLGQYSNDGWPSYFPVAFALKTNLPFLGLSVAALCWASFKIVGRRQTKLLWLLVPFMIYMAISMSSSINIGIRHLLPAFPFLFILAGMMLEQLTRVSPRSIGIVVISILLGWMLIEAVRTFPDYTPYMNQLAVGPHWKYLSDSNVEWGDDVNGLAAYLKSRGETQVRAALSGGWLTLPLYGIDYISLAPPGKQQVDTRYVAIGASFLNGSTLPSFEINGRMITDSERVNFFDSYRNRTPEAIFGGEIYLFRER